MMYTMTLISNSVIDITKFSNEDASDIGKKFICQISTKAAGSF